MSSILFCGFLDCFSLVVLKFFSKGIEFLRIGILGSWENVCGSRESFYKVKEGVCSVVVFKSISKIFGIIKIKNGEEKKGVVRK